MSTPQEIFTAFVDGFESRRAAANALGRSYVLVCHIVNGVRPVSKEIAEKVEELSRGAIPKERALWGDDGKSQCSEAA